MFKGGPATRGGKRALILSAAAVLSVVTAFATGLDRLALWQVVRACVANARLTGASFPCLAVDLSGSEERGDVVFRAPVLHDLVLAPTRRIVGIEDPFLQSPDAPNYFEAAWRVRSFLEGPGGRPPERQEVGLVVNSAVVRSQDQLHIHVGCLFPAARHTLVSVAPFLPLGEWSFIGPIIPHTTFWGYRVRGRDLTDVVPLRLAVPAFADKVKRLGDLMIMVVGVRVEGDDGSLILVSYDGAPHAWRVGADNLLARTCPAGPGRDG